MAGFVKKTWEARLGVGLNKFQVGDLGTHELTNRPDEITQEGDALSAENFNNLEDRIKAGIEREFDSIVSTQAEFDEVFNSGYQINNVLVTAGEYTLTRAISINGGNRLVFQNAKIKYTGTTALTIIKQENPELASFIFGLKLYYEYTTTPSTQNIFYQVDGIFNTEVFVDGHEVSTGPVIRTFNACKNVYNARITTLSEAGGYCRSPLVAAVNCSNLNGVKYDIILSGVSDNDYYVFDNCTNLTNLDISVREWDCASKTAKTTLHVFNSCHNISNAYLHDFTKMYITASKVEVALFYSCTCVNNCYANVNPQITPGTTGNQGAFYACYSGANYTGCYISFGFLFVAGYNACASFYGFYSVSEISGCNMTLLPYQQADATMYGAYGCNQVSATKVYLSVGLRASPFSSSGIYGMRSCHRVSGCMVQVRIDGYSSEQSVTARGMYDCWGVGDSEVDITAASATQGCKYAVDSCHTINGIYVDSNLSGVGYIYGFYNCRKLTGCRVHRAQAGYGYGFYSCYSCLGNAAESSYITTAAYTSCYASYNTSYSAGDSYSGGWNTTI